MGESIWCRKICVLGVCVGVRRAPGRSWGFSWWRWPVVACRQPSREPVTLTFFRPGWSQHDQKAERLLRQFTQETGIHVKDLPVPESTLDAMNLSRKLLRQGGSGPDVLGVDVVWPGILEGDLVDLGPSSAAEISQLRPELIPELHRGREAGGHSLSRSDRGS